MDRLATQTERLCPHCKTGHGKFTSELDLAKGVWRGTCDDCGVVIECRPEPIDDGFFYDWGDGYV